MSRADHPSAELYFKAFEDRTPCPPVPASPARDLLFQALAVAAATLGAAYLGWRWSASLNPDALAWSVVVALAETFAYLGAVLFLLSLWRVEDPSPRPAPATLNEIRAAPASADRPLRVDILIATYDEPTELVRLSVQDAKRITYPHPIRIEVHVLDDGRRPAMAAMAREEGVRYVTRETSVGYKAGNLTNGLELTDGDLVVVCDADTRAFPELLTETLGYFRDPAVAWVQTPQWFYDVHTGTPLPGWLGARLGAAGRLLGRAVQALVGPIAIGADPLGCDPQAFYDLVQRCRNWCNASFCCGAGSIHRREALMEGALKRFADQVAATARPFTEGIVDLALRSEAAPVALAQAARHTDLEPYRFHVSEDIYTSIALHADPARGWKSVYHPRVLSRMLSPQDLPAWITQRFKYASGTLDIARHDNPLRMPGLSGWQKLMYGSTIYAYLAPLWTLPLLAAPLVFFFTGASPVRAFDVTFFAHLVPFLAVTRLAFMVRSWGIPSWRSEQFHLSAFWLHLRALAHVLLGRKMRFLVTPKIAERHSSLTLAAPHLTLLGLTAAGIAWRGAHLASASSPLAIAFASNVAWSVYNALLFAPFIVAAAAFRHPAVAPEAA